MRLSALITTVVAVASIACSGAGGNSAGPAPLTGVFNLVQENGQALPADPFAASGGGCCITLSGSLTLSASTYVLITSHQNPRNAITFDNSEQGTYTRRGTTLTFTRTGGGGAGFPFLLAPGTVSSDAMTVTLLYGDEGPGSNQIRGVFRRQ